MILTIASSASTTKLHTLTERCGEIFLIPYLVGKKLTWNNRKYDKLTSPWSHEKHAIHKSFGHLPKQLDICIIRLWCYKWNKMVKLRSASLAPHCTYTALMCGHAAIVIRRLQTNNVLWELSNKKRNTYWNWNPTNNKLLFGCFGQTSLFCFCFLSELCFSQAEQRNYIARLVQTLCIWRAKQTKHFLRQTNCTEKCAKQHALYLEAATYMRMNASILWPMKRSA